MAKCTLLIRGKPLLFFEKKVLSLLYIIK